MKYVYFAVDVMAPGYLERLSDEIGSAGFDIRWSCELRLEKIFSAERCRKMAQAGCVCVSFGMESGNQRILDLIDKGTKVGFMSETMRNFAGVGIAVQLMAFSDFPTETPEEKQETVKFIKDNEPYWATGGLGTFLLTGTSMIAKAPEKFGITAIPFEDADSARALAFRLDSETGQRTALTEEADASFDESGGVFPAGLGRPWAGGTDTLHSMIYYERYGRRFFKDEGLHGLDTGDPKSVDDDTAMAGPLELNTSLIESPFNLQRIIDNRIAFCKYVSAKLDTPAEPTYSAFQNWAAEVPFEESGAMSYWLSNGQTVIRIEKLVYQAADHRFDSKQIPVKDLLAALPEAVARRMRKYLLDLEEKGMIAFALRPQKLRLVLGDESPISRDRALKLPSAPAAPPVSPGEQLVQIAF